MRVVLLIVDGLRPDAITPAAMPALHDFAARWWRTTARTITPSVTVPALTSLATGVSPATHGILQPGLASVGRAAGLRPLPLELKRHGRATAVVLTDLPGSQRLVARSMLSLAGVQAVVW